MSKRSKRMRFAAKQRKRRVIARIHKANDRKPGYLGAAISVTIDGVSLGPGALFMMVKP